uniref:uncharacterized protein LOC124064049 n=1 Tax=Scatophagus argus TaxID=75038 RepID=UPI001ED7EF93|nr:uncharacterized protein LOC124064049 [Scatophagus argus]
MRRAQTEVRDKTKDGKEQYRKAGEQTGPKQHQGGVEWDEKHHWSEPPITINRDVVRMELSHRHPSKSADPDDAIIYLLHRAYTHLDRAGSTVRVMFFDVSSAFNTIRPALLCSKLLDMQVNDSLVTWIGDYLTGQPQYSSQSCHLQKSLDDSAIVGCITGDQEAEYRGVLDSFVEWCGQNHLQLNIGKTKELRVDFRKMIFTMYESKLHWHIQLVAAGVQLGNSLFLTALPMVLKERCINSTRDSLNTTSTNSWQSTVSSFYMIYRLMCQLIPILPGLFLAWLGDRGWRKTPIVVPLIGFMLARLVMLLTLTLDWPMEVLFLEGTITGLCGGFTVFWSGTMTLLSLSSAQQDRSRHIMTAELTNGIAGVVGCVASGHLFGLTAAGSRPGVMTVVVCLLLYGFCLLYSLFFLRVSVSLCCKS